MKTLPILLSLFLAALTSGCLLGPNHATPAQSDMPAQFLSAERTGDTHVAPDENWWQTFDDPTLLLLLERGDASNLTILQAVQRIHQSRAALTKTQSSFWPSVDTSGAYSRTKTWDPDATRSSYNAGIDAAWEIDLFGAVRRSAEAASAELEAAGMKLEDARVSIAAEIATAYFNLRTSQTLLDIAHSNLLIQTQSLNIAQDKNAAGFGTGLDVVSAQAQIESTRAQIPSIQADIATTGYQLELLLGLYPGELHEILFPERTGETESGTATAESGTAALRTPHSEFRIILPQRGVPSDLMRRRPDVRLSEANLHAATARIGMAQADRFPCVMIGASAKLTADSLSSWSDATKSLGFSPSVSLPLFNAGAKKAQVAQYKAAAEEALLAYRATLLTAISEVETAWQSLAREQERGASLALALDRSREALDIATELYAAGEIEFLDVLTRQQSLLSAEQTFANNQSAVARHAVQLFKALGGGFQ